VIDSEGRCDARDAIQDVGDVSIGDVEDIDVVKLLDSLS
jgi:hypothetical protein